MEYNSRWNHNKLHTAHSHCRHTFNKKNTTMRKKWHSNSNRNIAKSNRNKIKTYTHGIMQKVGECKRNGETIRKFYLEARNNAARNTQNEQGPSVLSTLTHDKVKKTLHKSVSKNNSPNAYPKGRRHLQQHHQAPRGRQSAAYHQAKHPHAPHSSFR